MKSLFQTGKDMIHQMVKIRLKKSILKDVGGMIQKIQTDHHQEGEAYSHRKVTSNWTKYEIPSSSDDNDETESGTGPDYNFVLENSAKAADHLQLKAEKDWEIRHQEYHQDLFALNMTDLEAKLDAIPLYDIIDFRIEDLDVS
mgnify:CR=1 FL=1